MAIKPTADERLMRLRIQVLSPPPDVTFAVQKGASELVPPIAADEKHMVFEITLRLRPSQDRTGLTSWTRPQQQPNRPQ